MLQNSNTATPLSRKSLGSIGEQLVIIHLQKHGFSILQQNYRKRFGEIDIIAHKHDLLIFVEVKLRKSDYFELSQVVTFSKQKKIIKTAKAFILENRLYNVIYRFDIALITYNDAQHSQLTYIENAFTDTTEYS